MYHKINTLEEYELYWHNYHEVYYHKFNNGRKIYIGSNSIISKCRYCGKDSSNTSFRNKSHSIPEFLGNHQLISLDECDLCNKYFSEKLENHLAEFTMPYRLFGAIKGKNQIPVLKSKNKKSRIEYEKEKNYL